jgi:hypothetical protein
MEVSKTDLVPGKKYFLKWGITNLTILEFEFIKYFDNSILEPATKYLDEDIDEEDLDEEEFESFRNPLVGKIITSDDAKISLAFDNPLYPYMNTSMIMRKAKKIGLFKFIRVVNIKYNDPKKNTGSLPKRITLPNNYLHVVNNTTNIYIPNETLVWVNLDKVKIIEPNVEERIYQAKALTEIEQELPYDMTRQIGEFVGSKEYLNKGKGGKKSKSNKYKNKSKRHKNKTRKGKTRRH